MKSTCFNEVLDETVVEVNTDFQDAVEKLMAQEGLCRETDENDRSLQFLCTKKGDIFVTTCSRYEERFYSVRGKVSEENGRTVVKIYSIYSRSNVILRVVLLALYIISYATYAIMAFSQGWRLSHKNVILSLIIGAFLAFYVITAFKEKHNGGKDLEIMKNEVIKRAEAVNRWEE